VSIENDAFLGPSVVFTNVDAPRSFFDQKNYAKTKIGKGATLGANATIVCGNDIGEYAFVGAGAVVTRPVPAFAKCYGVPAEQKGWISRHGLDLDFMNSNIAKCPKTDEQYVLENGRVRHL
jgi:UDP-2-acetamido-3-amino-2,3-dideoxy-glucuronate N-acetyltransferase